MLPLVLLYAGSVIIALWGIAHIAPARGVVKDFGDISQDNRRIILMEWVAEGMSLLPSGRDRGFRTRRAADLTRSPRDGEEEGWIDCP